jgi:pilus assembly protein Flp/PilA
VNKFMELVKNLLQDESGQDLIEYALIAGLIGIAAVVGMTAVGGSVGNIFNSISTQLTSAV